MSKAPDNAAHRPDDKFDAAMRLVHDYADDCVEAGYTSTISESHVKMVNAIVALSAQKDAELQRLRQTLDFIRSRAHWEDERDMAPGGRWWFALLVDDGHPTFDEALRAAIKP